MPHMTIVSLLDADDDEFPIALGGDWEGAPVNDIEHLARKRLDELVSSYPGRGPRGDVRLGSIAYPSGATYTPKESA